MRIPFLIELAARAAGVVAVCILFATEDRRAQFIVARAACYLTVYLALLVVRPESDT